MSANYHSFRNIGFYFTQAEAICEKWRAVFTGFDPSVAVRVYGLRQEGAYVYVMYFGNEYRLCTADGILEKRIPNGDNGKGDSREGGAGEGKPEAGACENVAEQHMENGEKEILWDWDTGSRVLHTIRVRFFIILPQFSLQHLRRLLRNKLVVGLRHFLLKILKFRKIHIVEPIL